MELGEKIIFTREQFKTAFPFYFELDAQLKMISYGPSFKKIWSITRNLELNIDYTIQAPVLEKIDFTVLSQNSNQIFVFENKTLKSLLKGQIIFIESSNTLIFIGSPYLETFDSLVDREVLMTDFSTLDSTFEMLQIIKNKELQQQEINELHKLVKQKSDRIKMSETAYKATLDLASDIIYKTNENGFFTYANHAGERTSGYSLEELYKIRYTDLVRKDYRKKTINHYLDQVNQTKSSSYFEFPLISKSGTEVWIGQSVQINRSNNKLEFTALAIDISAQKKSEFALIDTKRKLESILNEMTDVVWSLSLPDLNFLFVTPSVEKLYGFTPKDWEKDVSIWEKVVYPEDKDIIGTIYNKLETKGFFSVKYRVVAVNGEIKWVNNKGKIILNENGEPIRIDGITQDRTQQYEAEHKLAKEHKLLETLIDVASSFININLNAIDTVFNDSLGRMAEFVDADRVYLFEYDFDERIISNTYEWCARNIEPRIDKRQKISFDLIPEIIAKHQFGDTFYVPNVSEMKDRDSEKKKKLEFLGIKSVITVPLFDNKKLIGFLGFDSLTNTHEYTEKEKRLLYLFGEMIVNVQNRQLKEHQLNYQEEKFRNIIVNMNLGLLEVNNHDEIVYANQSFCDISGFELEELKGKIASDIFLSKEGKELIATNKNKRENGISDAMELEVKNKKGEKRWWFLSGAPNYNDNGELIGSIGIHLDITKQKELEVELARSKSIAEAAAKAKELFLANMSHEIRTPLNVIIGMIRQLNKENLNEDQSFYVKQSGSSANHLLTILNNILDIAKIESGELALNNDASSISAVAANVHSILHSQAKEKELDFIIDISPKIKDSLLCDQVRIRQVLINIIGNAIKFTEKGFVSLALEVVSETESYQKLKFLIQDSGIGMSEVFISKIFDKFSQEQDTANRKFEGTGLGMAISNDLITLMGGKLQVESIKGKGSIFTFELEFEIGLKSNLVNLEVEVDTKSIFGSKILLVEDNEMNRFIAIQTLSGLNCDIIEAENGLIALDLLKAHTFDLILMDIQMPEMDGVEATKIIRNELKINTPIIALTANAFKHDVEMYLAIGMNTYITKPYDEKDFLTRVQSTISLDKIKESEENNDMETNTENLMYDLTYLKNLSKGNDAFVLKMVTLFIELAESNTELLLQALHENKLDALRKIAHKIKPSIDQMGIVSLEKEIRLLENCQENIQPSALTELVTNIVLQLREVAKQLSKM